MNDPLFLLGAGFNADAKSEVGPVYGDSIYIGHHEIKCGYPLVKDLWPLFGLSSAPVENVSIEELFNIEIERGLYKPMAELAYKIMEADYYLVSPLLLKENRPGNIYSDFFDRFNTSSFLTFNYDSLVELFLDHYKRWYPYDGYGVPVLAVFNPHLINPPEIKPSTSFVLHLHGSFCVYTSTTELQVRDRVYQEVKLRESPVYFFDPDSIGKRFPQYKSPYPLPDFKMPQYRVIAPVPNKATGLKQHFIKNVYKKSEELLKHSTGLVAIGYSFNSNDRSSYDPILSYFYKNDSPRLLVVTPDAMEICNRLKSEYPKIQWDSAPFTFKDWVKRGFPGIAVRN
jgi:hypothetical protein